jgi:hypothetical protein
MQTNLNVLAAAGLLALALGTAEAAHHEGGTMKTVENEVIELNMRNDEAGEDVKIKLDSAETGFRLHDLQPGESRTVTDAYGQTVTVTRSADGIQLLLDGQTYDLPAVEGAGTGHRHIVKMKHDGDVDMKHDADPGVQREVRIIRRGADDGFVLISPRPLDEATEQQIRDALAAIGLTGEIQILDQEFGPEMTTTHEEHHEVHVIREKIDAN